MGNAHQSFRGEMTQNNGPRSPMNFHSNHSENIEILPDLRRAKRIESFCKGICFGSRPVYKNERLYVRFADISTSWSGVLRFGFTAHDPKNINNRTLPRYACPDLTSKQGYWCKALGERYAETGNIVHFYIQRNGDVMYGVNGEEKGVFFSGVNPNVSLWPLVDVYGNTMAVEFVDGQQNDGSVIMNNLPPPNNNAVPSLTEVISDPNRPARYNVTGITGSFPFHDFHGKNTELSSDKCYATRKTGEYCNAYVFTSRPLHCGEKFVLQIHGVDRSFVGGLAFGLTSCDPELINEHDLPDDADMLLDRPEYWVVNKDLCSTPDVGDELTVMLTETGEVHYGKNNNRTAVLMHVDTSLPLWAFFDLYGNVMKVKSLGLATTSRPAAGASTSQIKPGNTKKQPKSSPSAESASNNTGGVGESNECVICCENIIDCALYSCGHMCLCFSCANTLKRDANPLCPMCRQRVKDIIKIYRS